MDSKLELLLHWWEVAGSSHRVCNERHRDMRIDGLGALDEVSMLACDKGNKVGDSPGSAEAANPGTIVDGENAACSISAK